MSDALKRSSLAAGIALAIMQMQPAKALSLGELRVQSGLGQPFVGTTTARIGPGETIASACITAPANGSGGLDSPAGLEVIAQKGATPGNYAVQIRTTQPLYEPMYEIRLQIDCPGGVALSKSYVVMLNLPMSTPLELTEDLSAPVNTSATSRDTRGNAAARSNPVQPGNSAPNRRTDNRRLSPSRGSIPAGQPYRVRNGDTLSVIAERVAGRPVGSTWRVAEMLFANNPDAFIRGDRDMLKLGALINIPTAPVLAGEELAQPAPAVAAPEVAGAAESTVGRGELVNVELGRPEEDLLREIRESNNLVAATASNTADETINSQSADLSPFADEAASSGDAAIAEPAAAAPQTDSPAVNAVNTTEQPEGMSPFMAVLAGVLMGALLALVMLGKNILGPLLEGRARRKAALEAKHVAPLTASKPAAKAAEAVTEDAAELPASVAAIPAAPTYGGGGIDVEIGAAPDHGTVDGEVDVDLFAEPEDNSSDAAMATANAPRVSLRPETESADATHFEDLLDGLDGTGTMRTLFDEETMEMADESESATAELPAVDASHADIDITDLESLSRRLQETQDDKLSATLTQALGLLEQDYEEEMTASQILDQREADAAFSQHKAKD